MNTRRFLPTTNSARLIWGIALFLVVYQVLFGFSPTVISWDTYGYYLYLPQTFIHDDLGIQDFSPIEAAMNGPVQSDTFYQAMKSDLGNWVIKYPIGLAIFYAPFFAIACLISWIGAYPIDGFSLPFQHMLTVGSLFYTILGLWFLRKILLYFYSDSVTSIVLIIIVFGTNYFHMHTRSHGMPHVYLFTAYAALIWFTIRWHNERKFWIAAVLGLILGLMTVSRVTEFIAIIIPLTYGLASPKDAIHRLKNARKYYKHFALAGLFFLVFVIPQLRYWKVFGGAWLYDSYQNAGEGLDFLHPYTLEFLFSYRKGWLIYTPIMFLALWGLFVAFKKKTPWKWTFLFLVLCFVFVASSWTTWWYAASFSQRPMVQLYPVLAIAIGLIVSKGERIRKGVLVFAAFCIVLNLFQTWQYNNGIIHIDRMTKSYYWKVFGRGSIPDGAEDYLLVNRSMTGSEEILSDPQNYQLKNQSFLTLNEDKITSNPVNEIDTLRIGPNTISPKFEESFERLCSKDHAWIEIAGKVLADSNDLFENIYVISTFQHKWEAYKYNYQPLNSYVKWNAKGYFDFQLWYLTPEVRHPNDQFQFYITNSGSDKTISFTELVLNVLQRTDKLN